MLTSQITKVIEHPDEPGVSFTLRRLSYRQVEHAAQAKLDALFGMMKSMQGIDIPRPNDEEAKTQANDPLTKYDRATVLRYGITAWTYEEPCDDKNKDELDEGTASWLFAAIITHSLRSADEGEASGSVSTATTA